jgi:Hydrazine synthase alpha subunit middle domain
MTPGLGRFALGALALALTACSGSGSLDIGGNQGPDPATVDFPVAYIQRTIPAQATALSQQRDALPDADLWLRDRLSVTATARNITQRVTADAPHDLRDLSISADGGKLLFAMRGPLRTAQDERDAPLWAIWEYTIASDTLRRIIASDTIAAEGNDRSPQYLPDGRIVFVSTRQRQSQAVLRDEGKPGFEAQTENGDESAFVLHVMNADGSDIHQISFNASHDLDPSVLADGRVMWTRWDRAPGRNGFHLYTANPDGTQVQLLYGANSHGTGTDGSDAHFVKARELPDGRVAALQRAAGTDTLGGALLFIDTPRYVENTQAVLANAGGIGPAQQAATALRVSTLPGPSAGGRFNSVHPLWDGSGRLLVSWSPCRLQEGVNIVACSPERLASPTAAEAAPLFSPWLIDPVANTFRPLFEPVEGVMVSEIVAAQPRALPAVRLDGSDANHDRLLAEQGFAVLDIRSVYDVAGQDRAPGGIAFNADPRRSVAAQRLARFLRLEKPVSMPDERVLDFDNAAFGTVPYMREILGYAPIEPDGSVRVRVPANVAFQLSVLDAEGRRLAYFPPHRAWLQLRPGEERRCQGCHVPGNNLSHGRDGLTSSAWPGATVDGQPFPNTQARFAALSGETMAQARARWSCANDNCRALRLSPDIVYTDEWTDPVLAGRAADAPLAYRYAGAAGLSTPPPASSPCLADWSATCRSTIHYEAHIHPLWSLPRPQRAADGVTLLADNRCTTCHALADAAGAARVPAGQLDLSEGESAEQPLHRKAYRELLFRDNEQVLTGGAVEDRVLVTIDPVTGVESRRFFPVDPSLRPLDARGSGRFFDVFAPDRSHAGWLTPAELRLLSEWVDLGAQYFNDPFHPDVPRD